MAARTTAKPTDLISKEDPEFKVLHDSLYGIAFMGTPHRGAELASTFYKIAKVFCPKKTVLCSQLIKSVKANSQFLLHTSASF